LKHSLTLSSALYLLTDSSLPRPEYLILWSRQIGPIVITLLPPLPFDCNLPLELFRGDCLFTVFGAAGTSRRILQQPFNARLQHPSPLHPYPFSLARSGPWSLFERPVDDRILGRA